MIKKIIIFTTGLISGYFIGKKIGFNKAQKLTDEQVNSTKEAIKKYYEDKLSEKDKIIEQKAEELMPKDLGVDPGINDADPSNSIKDPREQFQRIITPVQPNGPFGVKFNEPKDLYKHDPKQFKEALKKEVMTRPNDLPPTAIDTPDGYPDPKDTNAEPYLIRDVDYGTIKDFEMQELVLWKDNTVTTDDANYDVVSPTYLFKLLPEGWVNMFGWGDSDRYIDSLYFRNNREKKDIQISKQNRDFREWVEEVCPGRLDELDED